MEKRSVIKKFVGDKAFYKMVLAVAVPILVQNGISQFVNLLDNLMVGAIGTEQMSGVSICNQLLFVFNLCIFGGHAGAGIYGAQYYGKGDNEGVRQVFRFKLWTSLLLTAVGLVVLGFFREPLISLFLHEGSEQGDLAATLAYGMDYMKVMLFGLLPFALSQTYSSTLRETQQPMLPMKAGIAAVLVNLVGNYILIYGKFGAPEMGVMGAAVATVISRFVELGIIVIACHKQEKKYAFAKGLYKTLLVPGALALALFRKGLPLMINEALWSGGQTFMTQLYSRRGLAVVAALNISGTVSNLFFIAFLAMGNATGIVVGNLLGAGKLAEAKETNTRMTAFSVFCCVVLGVLLLATAGLFPMLYNTTEEVRTLAAFFLQIVAVCMPMFAYTNNNYFTLRSGGLVKMTILFDCGYVWLLCIPVTYLLTVHSSLDIVPVYAVVQGMEIIKVMLGYYFVKQGRWLRTLVEA